MGVCGHGETYLTEDRLNGLNLRIFCGGLRVEYSGQSQERIKF